MSADARFAQFALDADTLTAAAAKAIRLSLIVSGAVSLIAGLVLTIWPKQSAIALSWTLGVYFLIVGIIHVVASIASAGLGTGARVLNAVLGVLQIVAGVLVLSNAAESAVLFGIFLGIWVGVMWLIEGVIAIVQSGKAESRGWAIAFGLLSIVAGVTLLSSPLWGAVVLFWVAGISLIVLGLAQLFWAFRFGRITAASA